MTEHSPIEARIEAHKSQDSLPAGRGPALDPTHWGYSLHAKDDIGTITRIAAMGGRFFGVILLMAAAGLWVMPDAMMGNDVFAMKLAATVMFTIFGGYLYWVGSNGIGTEIQIDTNRGEIRVGRRSLQGAFVSKGMLRFSDVASVFLVRAKEPGQITHLYMRIGAGDTALEIAAGDEPRLDALRERLTRDLTRPTRPARAVNERLARHAAIAA